MFSLKNMKETFGKPLFNFNIFQQKPLSFLIFWFFNFPSEHCVSKSGSIQWREEKATPKTGVWSISSSLSLSSQAEQDGSSSHSLCLPSPASGTAVTYNDQCRDNTVTASAHGDLFHHEIEAQSQAKTEPAPLKITGDLCKDRSGIQW